MALPRSRTRLAAAALAAWTASAAAASGGVLAGFGSVPPGGAPEARRLLEADLRTPAFRLWELAGFGLDRSEHAAWVVATDAGLAWRAWPWDRRDLQARWSGPIPAGAIAIVHTHPAVVDPEPSETDCATAARLGVAVYTVSRRGIWKAEPAGLVQRIGDERWWAGCEAGKACREGVSVPFALASRAPEAAAETVDPGLRIPE